MISDAYQAFNLFFAVRCSTPTGETQITQRNLFFPSLESKLNLNLLFLGEECEATRCERDTKGLKILLSVTVDDWDLVVKKRNIVKGARNQDERLSKQVRAGRVSC
jgi:hypothetical protein